MGSSGNFSIYLPATSGFDIIFAMEGLENKNVQAFMQHLKRSCKVNGVRLRPIHDEIIDWNCEGTIIKVQGYFDENAKGGPILSYSTKRSFPSFLQLVVHEFQHMEQWLENSELLKQANAHSRFWKWLEHKIELTPEEVHISMLHCLRCEVDAERRSIAVIHQYQLPLNIEEVSKSMNWYLYFYQYAEKFRERPTKNLSYDEYQIIEDALPNELIDDYETVNEKILDLYARAYQPETARVTRKRSYSRVF